MTALILIRPHALQVYFSDHHAPMGIPLPSDVVTNMEVMSDDALSTLISKQLKPVSSSNTIPTILVLSDELCFVDVLKDKQEEEITQQLLTDTPFVHVATAILRNDKERLIIATNQDLYESVGKAVENCGFTVQAVLSWRGLIQSGVTTNGEIDPVTVKRTFDIVSSLRTSAFPFAFDHTISEKPKTDNGQPEKKKLPIGWIIFGGLALLYAIGMIVFMLRQ